MTTKTKGSRLTAKSLPGKADRFVPPKHACSRSRRTELKSLLVTMAAVLTPKANLGSLAEWLNKNPRVLSEWLHWGEVPPYAAGHLTRHYELKRRALMKTGRFTPATMALKDLAPALFLPE